MEKSKLEKSEPIFFNFVCNFEISYKTYPKTKNIEAYFYLKSCGGYGRYVITDVPYRPQVFN